MQSRRLGPHRDPGLLVRSSLPPSEQTSPDTVLVNSGTLGLLRPLDLNQVEVDVDAEGLSDTKLASILDNWYSDPATKNHSFPRVLYTMCVVFSSTRHHLT